MTKLQLYRPLSDAEPNMAEDSATGQFYWAADADTEIEALIRERHQLRNELTAARLEGERLQRELAVWKDCHGVTADALAAARASHEPSEVYDKIGVLRPDGELTTYEGCEGEPVYVRRALKSSAPLSHIADCQCKNLWTDTFYEVGKCPLHGSRTNV